ncbi:MAG TPA: hypothetical protein VFS87_06155 [Qipengyuania sp.]|nr:hypothetical protein [Qipengyuania sp.]
MARKGIGFFDTKGHFFKSPEEATISDIASLLGKVGDGESLAPGIAHILLRRREELEKLFAEHDAMMADYAALIDTSVAASPNVAKLPEKRDVAA